MEEQEKELELPLLEFFTSIEGEGKRAGSICTFIRLAGCNLKCNYCDTPHSQVESKEAQKVTVSVLKRMLQQTGIRNVTITGGEPLLHSQAILDLIKKCGYGYEFNIETNGTIDISEIRNELDEYRAFFTVDYKCKGSGVTTPFRFSNLDLLGSYDVIKFVVSNLQDLVEANYVVTTLNRTKADDCKIYFSPVFGRIEPVDIVNYIISSCDQNKVKLGLQLHKIVWDPQKRGV